MLLISSAFELQFIRLEHQFYVLARYSEIETLKTCKFNNEACVNTSIYNFIQ